MFRSLILIFISFISLEALKAVFFVPTLSFSHVQFNLKLAELLAQEDYQVTLLVLDIDPNVKYDKLSNVKTLHISANLEANRLKKSLWENPGPYEDASPLNPRIFTKFLRISQIMIDACKSLFDDTDLIAQLENENFDFGFVEQYDACGLGLLQRIDVRYVVWLSATAFYRLQTKSIGIDFPLSYVPELFSTFSHHMSLLERMENVLIGGITEITHKIYSIDAENRLARANSVDNQLRLGLLQYASNAAAVIANVSPLLDFAQPTASSIISVAGITVSERQQVESLNDEWLQFANSSTNGFVLITFGAIAQTSKMPLSLWNSLILGLKSFPEINFVIKHEQSENGVHKWKRNVFFTKWIPQIQLMSHPNYIAVITHGGWSTVLESLLQGQPMILMPLFADHFKNARVITEKGLGIFIDKMAIENETFVRALGSIINDQRYAKRCGMYAEILRTSALVRPQQAVTQRLRQISKHSISTLAKFYHPKRIEIPFYATNYLDLLALTVIVVALISR